jgi:putative transcriptional regulator
MLSAGGMYCMNDLEFGTIKLNLKELMEHQNLSLTKLSFRAEMQRTQLKNYYDGSIQRLDMAVLARLCYALDCNLHDLIEYIPPVKTQE